MAMKFVDGDYVLDNRGGFEESVGVQEMLERVLYKLTARRGGFPLMPELGSRLYLISGEKPSARQGAAEQYVMEALSGEPDIALESVSVSEQGGDALTVTVSLQYEGESLLASVLV